LTTGKWMWYTLSEILKGGFMCDLKLIDELLCRLRWKKPSQSLSEFKNSDSCVYEAMERLKQAWNNDEIPPQGLTMEFAIFFDEDKGN
jgi:hypothetical protein